MTHAYAFLQDILAHPDDDAPRLIFADWLEEQGDSRSSARAEFIRIQCALAGGEPSPHRRVELQRRQQQLLDGHGKEWVRRPFRRLLRAWNFHRGFIDDVTVSTHTFLAHAGRLFRHAPIQQLRLRPAVVAGQRVSMAALADNDHLRRLRALDLSDSHLNSRDVRALLVSEHLANLSALHLARNGIGDSGIRALAEAPLLGQLTQLDLRDNDFTARGVHALVEALEELARGPKGLRLTILDVRGNQLSIAGQHLLASSPLLRRVARASHLPNGGEAR